MLQLFAKIFGTKSQRDVKELSAYIPLIHKEYDQLKNLTHDQLREKTNELKRFIDSQLESIDQEIKSLHNQVETSSTLDIHAKEVIFDQIDAKEKERNEKLEKVLLEALPQGFAIIRETARRFKENTELTVTATEHDRQLAAEKKHIVLKGNQAVWSNTWQVMGNDVTWDMEHYDVQLIGGIVLHQGKIAEMATGEGKTLVATLPAFLNALTKRGVHIVTVNDYLAKRDSEWMGPLYEFHGLRVDCIDKHEPHSQKRKNAYLADIAYGTNNEFGFDYLRDNMAKDTDELVQRKHHFAMVDEVDSVLIDDARTPLIISGPVPKGDEHEFYELKPFVQRLVEEQKKLVIGFINEAKKKIEAKEEKEGGLALFRAFRGLPRYKPLIKYLSEMGIKSIMQKTENYYLQDNSKQMPEADSPLYFVIDERSNSVDLTDKGLDLITGDGKDTSFFILPDLGVELTAIENNTTLSLEEKVTQKEQLIREYGVKSQRIHTVNQLLKAYALFEKDVDYIIVDSKVKIVDEQTGRVLEGRRYSDGLHQAIEAKENVKVEDATQTYATITLQNYFRMYHKLAGMTGTAETEAGEFWEIYKLDVVTVPTNKPSVRDDKQDKVYKTMREKFNAVVDEVISLTQQGRPVLVGTTSVEISEVLSRMLTLRKIKHQVLNAKQHQKEAEVVAEAGKPGTVTIATNMAGRGTDIKLTPESKKAGGLAIIGTERHESRRVDRQLRGRSGRQGDVGSSQFFVSLEDNLMRLFGSDRIVKIMDRLGMKEGEVIQHPLITRSIERAQKKVEENNFGVRKRLLEYDNIMNSQREVIYKRRRNALFGERLQFDVMSMVYDTCESIVQQTKLHRSYDQLKMSCLSTLGLDTKLSETDFENNKETDLTSKLYQEAYTNYQIKNSQIVKRATPLAKDLYETRGSTLHEVIIPFTDGTHQFGIMANLKKLVDTNCEEMIRLMEKTSVLNVIDQEWKEHLRDMDDLKQSVQNAVYEQKDPLLIYKFEAFQLFKIFIGKVNEDTVSFLMKGDIPVSEPNEVQEAKTSKHGQKLQETKEESKSVLSYDHSSTSKTNTNPIKSQKVAGRNDRVTVQYIDGTIKKDVKYKVVEEDINNNKCVIIDE